MIPWYLATLALLLFSGCREQILTQWPQPRIFAAYFRLQEVKPGLSREEVEGLMGPPQLREEGNYPEGYFIIYFYRTHNMDYEGSDTVRGGYTPLVFRDNRLVGKGRRDYQRTVGRLLGTPPPPPVSSPLEGSFPKRSW